MLLLLIYLKNTPKITAIIPTLNEELHIQEAIDSVGFADEIMVIDSFSSDRTIEIAKKNKVRILQRVFDDFSTQKNYAIEQASHDWIYILDADERVTESLKVEIIETLQQLNGFVGFYVFRTFYFFGKKLNYSGWQRDKVIRLFDRNFCKYDGKLVHETIEHKGEIGFLKNKLEHYSYRDYDHYVTKLNHYSTLKAKSLFNKGKRVNLYHILIKPPARFVSHYFVKLGFLDGYPGFVISAVQANGVLTRYIKLWRLRKTK